MAMPAVAPQSLALAVAAAYCFAKFVILTGSYRSDLTIGASRGAAIRPWVWTVLPATAVMWAAVASVWDLPCAAAVPPSTVAVWVVAAVVPIGVARVTPLVTGYAAVSAGVALWATTTDTRCLFVAVTSALAGGLSMLLYASASRLAAASVATALELPKQILGVFDKLKQP
jgi:hypothetical protein